ncbi:hypothetical protein IFM89_003575 [Coptis chinensis]|uniref:RING-type domain-containing protein n=1 Tax=Coptis chinensis TaxID=261450 RepID=A0A835M233_9MAGN|nr:hypothetical protein IFM89_003575 [Coptis chinensis]
MHPTVLTNAHTSVVPPTMPPPNGDDVELAMAVNASLLLAREEMPQIMDSHSSPEVSNAIGWGSSADISSHNGWLSAEGAAPSEASSSGWLDEPAEEAYNGWGTSETESSSNRTEQNISAPGTTSVSLGNSANTSSHHGSGPIGGSAFSSKESCGGWLNNQSENVQNGWGMSETGSRSNQNNSTSVPLTHATPQTASVPSAPPVPEGADDGPIQYPSIDFSPVDWTMPNMDNKDSRTSQTKEDGGASSSCVICLDAPVEGACVPCGHMAGCMSCLNGIKAKEWGCPVCRAKIKQVIRLYAV